MSKKILSIFKIGGNIVNDETALENFLKGFARFSGAKILIHGGGVKASETLKKMGIPPKMIDGRRVTCEKTLEAVTMVYAGGLNKKIVAKLQAQNCNALGLSGADGNVITAHKRPIQKVDYGFVGDVDSINAEGLAYFLKGGLTPVFCALTHDKKGQLLNTNADTIAASLAVGLAEKYAVSLWYLFEKKGVLKNINEENSVIENIDFEKYQQLKKQGVIAEGMLPKMENCFNALKNGVAKVKIAHADSLQKKQKHTTLTL